MSDLYVSLPLKVKVGPFTFFIDAVPGSHADLGEENYGMTLLDKAQIYINAELTDDRLLNTVLHEVGHVINHAYGIEDSSSEETVATQSANGWMQVYLDNPRLLDWIQRAVRSVRKTR